MLRFYEFTCHDNLLLCDQTFGYCDFFFLRKNKRKITTESTDKDWKSFFSTCEIAREPRESWARNREREISQFDIIRLSPFSVLVFKNNGECESTECTESNWKISSNFPLEEKWDWVSMILFLNSVKFQRSATNCRIRTFWIRIPTEDKSQSITSYQWIWRIHFACENSETKFYPHFTLDLSYEWIYNFERFDQVTPSHRNLFRRKSYWIEKLAELWIKGFSPCLFHSIGIAESLH